MKRQLTESEKAQRREDRHHTNVFLYGHGYDKDPPPPFKSELTRLAEQIGRKKREVPVHSLEAHLNGPEQPSEFSRMIMK